MTIFDDIRERDANLHYCATCHDRVYNLDSPDERHNITVEQCDAWLQRTASRREAVPRQRIDGHLCWAPKDHHPFVEGEIPDYQEAERDRRYVLQAFDDAWRIAEDALPCRCLESDRCPFHEFIDALSAA